MSSSAKSVFVFGIYLSVLGITLMAVPNALLSLFGIPATDEVWIRIVGMLILFLSVYYYRFARSETVEFFWVGIYLRSSVIIFLTAFVLAGYVKPVLILFGVIDLAGALWTWWAMKRDYP
jgi:hypothetical protein